jgi:hypothetical protein
VLQLGQQVDRIAGERVVDGTASALDLAHLAPVLVPRAEAAADDAG